MTTRITAVLLLLMVFGGALVYAQDATDYAGAITFMADREGSWDIYAYLPDTGETVPLMQHEADEYHPTLSADGQWLAFASDADGDFDIYILNVPNGTMTQITVNNADDLYPSWTPDADALAYASDELNSGTFDIYAIALDAQKNASGSPVALTGGFGNSWLPKISPDGAQIAFINDGEGNSEVYVMNADGSSQTNVSNSDADDNTPSWSPDGSWLAFTSNRDGNYDIYSLNLSSGQVFNLTDSSADDQYPAWSPDGDALVFASNGGSRGQHFDLYLLDTDGQTASSAERLTSEDGDDWSPMW